MRLTRTPYHEKAYRSCTLYRAVLYLGDAGGKRNENVRDPLFHVLHAAVRPDLGGTDRADAGGLAGCRRRRGRRLAGGSGRGRPGRLPGGRLPVVRGTPRRRLKIYILTLRASRQRLEAQAES